MWCQPNLQDRLKDAGRVRSRHTAPPAPKQHLPNGYLVFGTWCASGITPTTIELKAARFCTHAR
jgi:hypothetical protein